MSLLSRDRFHIALCPDRVLFLHRRKLWRSRVENKATWEVAPREGSAPVWRQAVEALRQHLPTVANASATASIVLSSHFCHYALIGKNENLAEESEVLAYARHRLRKLHGEMAGDWTLKLSAAGMESGHVVSGVDRALLERIRNIFNNQSLTSVQPYFAVAFNRSRKALENRTAWLVVHEDGKIVVSLFHNGRWKSVAARRTGPQWKTELMNILDREAQLLGTEEAECKQVLLYAPHLLHANEFKGGRYQVELLHPDVARDLDENDRIGYAMAA